MMYVKMIVTGLLHFQAKYGAVAKIPSPKASNVKNDAMLRSCSSKMLWKPPC